MRSWPCSAPTVPASRRLLRRCAAWRRTTARCASATVDLSGSSRPADRPRGRGADARRQGDLPHPHRGRPPAPLLLDLPQGEPARISHSIEDVSRPLPRVLKDRTAQMAGDLSGGEQQQLAMAMTLLLWPRVLLIDELSLGLSTMIVSALCDVVREVNAPRHHRDRGGAVGQRGPHPGRACRVHGEGHRGASRAPPCALLEWPDLLRSVFIEGAGVAMMQFTTKGVQRRST